MYEADPAGGAAVPETERLSVITKLHESMLIILNVQI
jgi:hypothetical protein